MVIAGRAVQGADPDRRYVGAVAARAAPRARWFRSSKELFGDRKFGLIIIDYLQLMRGSPQVAKASREQEISEISRGLKALAKELNYPVLALSQLNRPLEQRTDKRPQLSDLRESGAIESENPNIAEVIIGKNCHSATGTVETHFEGRFTRFENLSQRPDGPGDRG